MAVNPPFLNTVLAEGLEDSFLASANITQYCRVQLMSDGTIQTAANAADKSFGVAKQPINNGTVGVVRLDAPEVYGLSNTLINVADTVYQAAGGYVSATLINNAQLGVAKIGSRAQDANTGNNATPIVILAVRKSSI